MATFKAIVEPHYLRQDGTYNIKIRVQHNNKKRYISTQWYITKEDLTRNFKLKTQSYIDATEDLCREYRHTCDQHIDRLHLLTVEQVVDLIKNHKNNNSFTLDFIEFSKEVIEKLKQEGRGSTAGVYQKAINSLKKYINRDYLDINEITSRFMLNFIEYLKTELLSSGEKSKRRQSLYPGLIRSIHNMAKLKYNDEDIGIINIPLSPFAKVKIPKVGISQKRAISVEQIQAIMDIPYSEAFSNHNKYTRFNLAKDIFLLSFFLMGINAVDLYNCQKYSNGILTYYRTKTRNRREDHAEMQIRIEPEIKFLFEKYRNKDKSCKNVFEFYKKYKYSRIFGDNINMLLKTIGEKINENDLQFYAARHSWATIANNVCGVDKLIVHEALIHVNETMKITDTYIKKDYSLYWEANRKVISLFDFSKLREMNDIR